MRQFNMRSKLLWAIFAALTVIVCLAMPHRPPVSAAPASAAPVAQIVNKEWSEPQLLSTTTVQAQIESYILTDNYGYAHVFWRQLGPDDQLFAIEYTRFDGRNWTPPLDIYVTASPIGFISPYLDAAGVIHVAWSEGNSGPVMISSAPAYDTLSAWSWSPPVQVEVPAYRPTLVVDKRGTYHLVYSDYYGTESGVYYVRSRDGGDTWSEPYWLDPDAPPGYAPSYVRMVLDVYGGLHVAWDYLAKSAQYPAGLWVRYAHSLDGGQTWEFPIMLDETDDEPEELRMAYPNITAMGEEVLVLWAGTQRTNREYRISRDQGGSWSDTVRIFGGLEGQAAGDGLAVDGLGRVHFIGQIRWPQGLYHAVWQDGKWTEASMLYLIASSGMDARNGRYHAHNLEAGILNGNQLIVLFTDEVDGPLYVTYRTLEDVPEVTRLPLPTPTPTPGQPATATPLPATPAALHITPLAAFNSNDTTITGTTNLSMPIWQGILPAFLFLLGVVVMWLLRHGRGPT